MDAVLSNERDSRPPAEWSEGQEFPGPDRRTFLLPLGYVGRDGSFHREVELKPLTGREQRLLAGLSPQATMATVTTALLSSCLQRIGSLSPINASLVRELLAGDREFLLLKLLEITFGGKLYVTLRCPAEGCDEPLEVPLEVGELTVEAPPLKSRTFFFKPPSDTERRMEFRLPAGGDQEAIARRDDLNEEEQRELILAACLQGQHETANALEAIRRLSLSDREQIELQMKALAPQLEVTMEAVCPACGANFTAEVDVPFLVLAEMSTRESGLDWEIHFLAWHYHWSEAEILALGPTRRRRYIELLQEELERMGVS
jgi:hypothetical protein